MDYFRRKHPKIFRVARGKCSKDRALSLTSDTAHLLAGQSDDESEPSPQETAFPFLDLPPELRNAVYEKLLLFQSTDKCHPQILASCKSINEEASGILYENNRILIDIEMHGVFTHGARCGRYVPAQRYIGGNTNVVDFTAIKWPEYLRRVRLLYIDIPNPKWYRFRAHSTRSHWTPIPSNLRKASIGNVLYSLCVSLRGDHHQHLAIGSKLGFEIAEELKTAHYSMRFLGFASVSGPRPTTHQICTLYDEKARNDVLHLRTKDRKPKIAFLRGLMNIITHVAVDHRESRVLKALGKVLASVIMMGAGVVATIDSDTGDHCYDSDRVFTNTVKYAIVELRILLETADVTTRSEELQKQIDWLLRLDVELRATPTPVVAKKVGKKAHNLERQEQTARLMEPNSQPGVDVWSKAPMVLKRKCQYF